MHPRCRLTPSHSWATRTRFCLELNQQPVSTPEQDTLSERGMPQSLRMRIGSLRPARLKKIGIRVSRLVKARVPLGNARRGQRVRVLVKSRRVDSRVLQGSACSPDSLNAVLKRLNYVYSVVQQLFPCLSKVALRCFTVPVYYTV